MSPWTVIAALFLILASFGAGAEDVTPPSGRYQIVKATETTAWRLDTHTGEIVACRFNGMEMICGSTETAVTRPKTSMDDYKTEQAADRRAMREEDLAFFERVVEIFKSMVAFFMDREKSSEHAAADPVKCR